MQSVENVYLPCVKTDEFSFSLFPLQKKYMKIDRYCSCSICVVTNPPPPLPPSLWQMVKVINSPAADTIFTRRPSPPRQLPPPPLDMVAVTAGPRKVCPDMTESPLMPVSV
jgi:hypothetical protein